MSMLTVPIICSPLQNQAVKFAATTYQHLNGLSLADSNSSDENESSFGSFKWGESGPTALHTKIGWVLSGPVQGSRNWIHASQLHEHSLSEWKQGYLKNNFRKIRHWIRNCPNSGNSNRSESCQKKDPYMKSSTTASSTRMVDTK